MTTRHSDRVTVYVVNNSNIAGYEWSSGFWITRRQDGLFSVGATQTTKDPPAQRLNALYPLRDATSLWDALNELIGAAGCSLDPRECEDVLGAIRKLDKRLAAGVQTAIYRASAAHEQTAPTDVTLDRCVAGATWIEEPRTGAGGMIRWFHMALRRNAARVFAK